MLMLYILYAFGIPDGFNYTAIKRYGSSTATLRLRVLSMAPLSAKKAENALNGAEKNTLERTLPLRVRCGCLRGGVGTTAC